MTPAGHSLYWYFTIQSDIFFIEAQIKKFQAIFTPRPVQYSNIFVLQALSSETAAAIGGW
jgi:hypothetical protein